MVARQPITIAYFGVININHDIEDKKNKLR